MKSTTIIFVRHGLTDWNVEGRWQGYTDIPLNATGRAQARAAAQRIAKWPVEAIYTSDAKRAAETAEIIGRAMSMEPIRDKAWRERYLGELEGLTTKQIQEKYPHLVLSRAFIDAPGGETYEQLRHRVLESWEELLEDHEGNTILIVSHGGTLRLIISHVLGLPDRFYAPFWFGNTGITKVVVHGDGRTQVTVLNDTSHLGD